MLAHTTDRFKLLISCLEEFKDPVDGHINLYWLSSSK